MKKRTTRLGRGNKKGGVKGRVLPRKVKGGYKLRNRVVPFSRLAKKWQTGLRKKWQKTRVSNAAALKYLSKLEGPEIKRGKVVGAYRIGKKEQNRILKQYGAKWILKRQKEQQKAIDKARLEGDFEAGYTSFIQAMEPGNKFMQLLYFYH